MYIRLKFQNYGFGELSELFQNISIQVYSKKKSTVYELKVREYDFVESVAKFYYLSNESDDSFFISS